MTYFLHRFSAPLRLSTPFMYIKEESVGFISAILRFWVLIGNIPELAETTSPWYCPGPHSQACRTLSRSWRRGRKTVTGSEGLELCVPASSWHPPEPAQGHCKAGLLSCLRGAAPALSPSWALARAPGRRQERHPQDVCRPSAAQPGLVIPPCFLHLVLEACVQEGRYVSPQTLRLSGSVGLSGPACQSQTGALKLGLAGSEQGHGRCLCCQSRPPLSRTPLGTAGWAWGSRAASITAPSPASSVHFSLRDAVTTLLGLR